MNGHNYVSLDGLKQKRQYGTPSYVENYSALEAGDIDYVKSLDFGPAADCDISSSAVTSH